MFARSLPLMSSICKISRKFQTRNSNIICHQSYSLSIFQAFDFLNSDNRVGPNRRSIIQSFNCITLPCPVPDVTNTNMCLCIGECWSGKTAEVRYNIYGAAEQCIDTHQQPCAVNSVGECAGDQNSNYVYRIVISPGLLN